MIPNIGYTGGDIGQTDWVTAVEAKTLILAGVGSGIELLSLL